MINTELKRDNNGRLSLWVSGAPVDGAAVASVEYVGDKMFARVLIPLDKLQFGEVTNVVPLVKRSG